MLSRLSLRYRIAVIIFLLEAVMMTVVLQKTLGQSYDASSQQIRNNQLAILELVKGISKPALITEEFAEIQPYIRHLVANTEVSRLLLTDSNKIIVASNSSLDLSTSLPELMERKNYSWQSVEIKNVSGLMGILAIEFSNEELKNTYNNARDFGVTIALVGMLIIAAIGLLVGFLLTRRLAIITDTAQRLADGDLTARTNIHAKDEIGTLAQTFDGMVSRLLKSQNELTQTLSTLQESEQNLSVTLDSIGDAVVTTDVKGNVTRMNPVAEQLTGWKFKEANGLPLKTIFPIINASTRETIESPIDKVISTGKTVYLSNHTTLMSKDGTEYQIADSAAPIRNGNNSVLGMVLIFNDVTEQYLMREAIQSKEKEQREILNSIVDAVISIDEKGKILTFNNSAELLFGYKADDVKGKNIKILMPESYAKHHDDYLKRYLKTNEAHIIGKGVSLEVVGLRKNKESFPLRLMVAELPNKTGSKRRFIGSCVDLSELKQQEEQLQRTHKMDALGKLTGGIAHDYNNMLGVILGYSELLIEIAKDNPTLVSYVKEISHAGERGAKLTKKLLNFSRKTSSDKEVLNLNSVLQEAQHMLEKTLTARINLKYELSEEPCMVNLEESELEDAVLNICINAMHAIEGNGNLTINTRIENLTHIDAQLLNLKLGDYVLLSISDTGRGMDETTKEKIFDPFYSTKGDKGTGLGLSQVYSFVERSGGTIEVFSELKHGTRLVLYFPIYHGENVENKNIGGDPEDSLNGTETILIVDDEAALTKLISNILSVKGYQVLCAHSANQALQMLEKNPVDLLFSDVVMPEMDGYQLASIVKEKYPSIKIQLASGFSDDRQKNYTVDNKLHQNLLDKPFQSRTLLKRIRELLDNIE